MTLQELATILNTTGYSVAYSHFSTKQIAPFITYKEAFTNNIKADLRVLKKRSIVQVELYTIKKDLNAEKKLEQVFDENEITYDCTEIYIESENIFQRVYNIII